MQKIISTRLSSKGQVTIPKEAREILSIKNKNDMLGFIIDTDTHSVKLTRLNVTPADEEFTEEEYAKLLKLADKPSKKTFKNPQEAIEYHKKLTKR